MLTRSNAGKLCVNIVREFLSFCKLEHTLTVFVPEANLVSHPAFLFSYQNKQTTRTCNRDELLDQLRLQRDHGEAKHPVLFHMISQFAKPHPSTPPTPLSHLMAERAQSPTLPSKFEPNESYPQSPPPSPPIKGFL